MNNPLTTLFENPIRIPNKIKIIRRPVMSYKTVPQMFLSATLTYPSDDFMIPKLGDTPHAAAYGFSEGNGQNSSLVV